MNLSKYIILGLLLTALTLTCCTSDSECKYCEVVTYSSTGAELSRVSAIEYCGSSLEDIEDTEANINGDETTVWECN